jgi:hypothetical protein
MKTSIAFTLIIIAAVFSFVSGYSIGSHNDQAAGYNVASQSGSTGGAVARAAENPPEPAAPAGGYGSPAGEVSTKNTAAAPGYGAAPTPGYGK